MSIRPITGGSAGTNILRTGDGAIDPDIGAAMIIREAPHAIIAGGASGIIQALALSISLQLISHWVHQLEGTAITFDIGDLNGDIGLGVGGFNPINGSIVIIMGDVVQEDAGVVVII